MEALVHGVHHANHFIHTRLGRQKEEGSGVGATIVRPRVRQSNPDKPPVYMPYWAGNNGNVLGSNLQDGDDISYGSGGGQPKMFRGKFIGNRSFKHKYGYRFHSIIPEMAETPTSASPNSIGPYSWRLKQATARQVYTKGNKFFAVKPLPPQGYVLPDDQMPRGGLTPNTLTLQANQGTGVVNVTTGETIKTVPKTVRRMR